jgi:hypothetical protein
MLCEGLQSKFIYNPKDVELLRCLRRYQKTYNLDVAPGTTTEVSLDQTWDLARSSTGFMGRNSKFQIPMRVAPEVHLYDAVGNKDKISLLDTTGAPVNNVSPASPGPLDIGHNGFRLYTSYTSVFSGLKYHYTADADFY